MCGRTKDYNHSKRDETKRVPLGGVPASHLHLDELEDLLVVDHVALVEEDDEVRDADLIMGPCMRHARRAMDRTFVFLNEVRMKRDGIAEESRVTSGARSSDNAETRHSNKHKHD